LTVVQSTFDHNSTLDRGGAIYDAATSSGQGGVMTVQSSTFSNNISGGPTGGGAVYLRSGASATIVDSTFSGNNAANGGAILVHNTGINPISLHIDGCTLSGNSAQLGGVGSGLGVISFLGYATVVLTDDIVAGNLNFQDQPDDVFGAVDPSSAFNLIGDGGGMTGISNGVQGNQVGAHGAPLDPKLGPLQDNGGPTFTMALLAGSPAADQGGPDTILDALTAFDQRGDARIVRQPVFSLPAGGDGRDIGAFEELPTILTVNSLADAGPPSGVLTLRQAIQAATRPDQVHRDRHNRARVGVACPVRQRRHSDRRTGCG
jgi:hypothetical protein